MLPHSSNTEQENPSRNKSIFNPWAQASRLLRAAGIAIFAVTIAGLLRAWPLEMLGGLAPWLTFYPAVILVALLCGFSGGLLATALSCFMVIFAGPLLLGRPVINNFADWLALGIFSVNGLMIAVIVGMMHRARERLRKSHADMTIARDNALAADRAKSRFLASMSHELRTPLNAILGFTEVLREQSLPNSTQREHFDIIQRSGQHLLALINQVLDLAKIEAGSQELTLAKADLRGLLKDIVALLRPRAEAKNLILRLECCPLPRLLRTDAGRLRQILINLIGNAIAFTERGEIVLRVVEAPSPSIASDQCWLHFFVQDSGMGISPQDQARIFEPFVQVSEAARQQGTGLGLAIAKKMVGLLGGRLTVRSMPGQGSTFMVELPFGVLQESLPEAVIPAVTLRPVLKCGHPGFRILIVEDEEANWQLLRLLMNNLGLEVRLAKDGVAGIEAFCAWKPHLIWMDVRMPVMDGLEATRRIRTLIGGTEVKIVALTASVFAEQREEVLAAGMDDFLRKPYQMGELYACLLRQLGEGFTTVDTATSLTTANDEATGRLCPGMLAHLPKELCAELKQALLCLDKIRIADLCVQVSQVDTRLGSLITRHADCLEYSLILQCLTSQEPS